MSLIVKRVCDICGRDISQRINYKIRKYAKFDNGRWGWVKQDICSICMTNIINATCKVEADKGE